MSFAEFLDAYNALVEKARDEHADRRRPDRRQHLADQPRRDRHGRLGPAADGRPGHDRRHRLDRLPGRARSDRRADRRREGHDDDLDLRPPDHPGRRVGPLPAADRGAAPGRGRLLRARVRRSRRVAAGPLPPRRPTRGAITPPAGVRASPRPRRQPRPTRSCCRPCRRRPRCSRPTAPTATSPPSSTRSAASRRAIRRSTRTRSG